MDNQKNHPLNESLAEHLEQTEKAFPSQETAKKPFVEPVVSVPVDVLEATTFFQIPTLDTSDA